MSNLGFHIALEAAGHKLKRNEYGSVDIFVMDEGCHNGPGCELCGESWCQHCEPKITPCHNAEQKAMTDNQQAALECQRCDYECFCGYEAMTTDRDNQQAARELPSVRDIPDGELVRRAIGNIRPSKYRVLWGLVAERFALGSNYACDLCRIHGFNPEARKPSEMRAAPPCPTQEIPGD